MTHPLTDEIISKKFKPDHYCLDFNQWGSYGQMRVGFDNDDLRAAYDLGESKGRDTMLNEVIHWLKTTQWYLNPSTMADLLEEAMRPQQLEEN